MMGNALYYGDNLDVLREHIKYESVDLVYLDPPFNSNANYNVLFKAPGGEQSQAQIEAFEDTWHWNENAERAFDEVMTSGNTNVADMLNAMRGFLGQNDMMAYLAMMAVRLIELHRVLKKTGSLYLHCDPTASHYLKILLDAVFGSENYRNEITWKRTSTHSDSKTWSRNSDIILFYTRSSTFTWNTPREAHGEEYITDKFRDDDGDGRGAYQLDNMTSPSPRPRMMYEWKGFPFPPKGWRFEPTTMVKLDSENRIWYPTNEDGSYDTTRRPRIKRYLAELEGGVMGVVWGDIAPLNSQAKERLGYPTQKPVALLERILNASSNEGDVVLDPFCGCGTTVHAAQKLNRQWIGIDVTPLAVSLIQRRLIEAFPNVEYETHGIPKDMDGAKKLALDDKHDFQLWLTIYIGAQPYNGGKKGADGGIDGLIYFKPDGKRTERAIVSVKGGDNVSVAMVRDLKGVLDREKAPIGIFLSLAEPTKPMIAEAASAGFYDTGRDVEFSRRENKIPRLQILTVQDLFEGKRPQIPFGHSETLKKAPTEKSGKQDKLL
jgi:site-specific DNA-methyltransferase (adenine-specific)